MSNTEKHTKGDVKISGVYIKTVNYAFIVILSVFAIILFAVARNVYVEYLEIKQLADDYDRIHEDAENVNAASDDLTKDVQLFVMRGDAAYIDDYFREANEIKRRESAVEDLKELKVSDDLIELLENSVQQSMELMNLEYDAMRYAAEGYHISVSDMPPEVQNVKLPAEAETMTDAEKLKKAEELVFGDEYYGYKKRIGDYQKQCLEHALADISTKKSKENEQMRRLLIMLNLSLAGVCMIGVFLFIFISQMVVNPLNSAVESISQKERIIPLKGTYEIKYMSHVYNRFYHDSVEIQKKLKRDAERDGLTGVLNRRGHQTVTETLSTEKYPIALLIVDIDNFKHVNDTYGHETGDLALKKLAGVLLDTFRSTDITSRIGGDEFVVIMGEVTPENKDVIEKKAEAISKLLSVPGPEKCPSLTVSIGCAFSANGYSDQLFGNADKRMYDIKKSGGNGIGF